MRLSAVLAAIVLLVGLPAPAAAGLFTTQCAGRKQGEAYQNQQAVAVVRAAARGDATAVASLVAHTPALANWLEDGAVPPLLWAICADSVEGFEALLKAGADPNLGGKGSGRGDANGNGRKEHGSIIERGWSATVMAAGSGRPDFLRLALRHGGDANAGRGEREPNRPLLKAAEAGLLDNVKTLIDAGADINAHDRGGSALDYAIGGRGRFDIAVWLLEHGYNHDLAGLARGAEIRHVRREGEQQRWKETLIGMLRERGLVFPATERLRAAIERERVIPPEAVEDLIMGRKGVYDFPERKKP